MMRSLFSAVSGLRVHQTKMDVIANNVANVNTVGYKSSRVTFYDVFNQTLSSASGASPETGRGGRNPMQIGLGANVASIDQLMSTGATQRTDNAYDVMIQGEGFFVMSDSSGYYFTRAGAFRIDDAGNLTNATGLLVNGWSRVMDTNVDSATYGQYIIEKGKVQPIVITPEMEYTKPAATTMIKIDGNLNAALDGDGYVGTMAFFDTIGNRYVTEVKYTYDSTTGEWEVEILADSDGNDAYLSGNESQKYNLKLGFSDGAAAPANTMKIKFDTNGDLIVPANGLMTLVVGDTSGTIPAATFGKPVTAPAAGTPLTDNKIAINLSKLTQGNIPSNPTGTAVDGKAPGKLIAVAIGGDGVITGTYSNGHTEKLAQIAIAQFKNPAGLEKVGNSLFVTTNNSGDFDGIGVPPGTGGSSLLSGSLEMANVDLASEFTEMITTQRGFQANSRVITTSDDMLQELVNLKR